MSANKNLWLATASTLVLLTTAPAMAQTQPNVTVTTPDGPAEQAGEAVDDAAGAGADAAGDAAEQAGDAANEAADAAGEAAGDAAQATEEAADDAARATEEAAETAEAEPAEGTMDMQPEGTHLASDLMGGVIVNASDEEVGSVSDMVVSPEGQIEGVVIGVGGFLGVGQKNVAVSFSRVEMSEDENGDLTFMLDTTTEELEAASEFMTIADAEAEAESNAAPTGGTGGGATTTPAAPQ